MESQHNRNADSDTLPRPFQFSLRTLLAVTTVLAVGFSLLIASPVWVRGLTGVLATLCLPAVLTVALVYGSGYVRTFSIAALFPAAGTFLCLTLLLLAGPRSDDFERFLNRGFELFVIVLVLSAIAGTAGIATRRIIESWNARPEDR